MKRPEMVSAGESIVGTLVVRGIIKPGDAELAIAIVEEELGVWNDRERACFRLALSSENNTDTPTPV
jgi:predicted phosphoribosyltransferase